MNLIADTHKNLLLMKYLLFSCALFLMPLALMSQSAPLLEIDGISGGLRLPRLSNSERDALEFPGNGTTIYNTSTGCLNYYTGTFWSEVCGKPIGVSTCYSSSECPSGFYCDYAILVDGKGVCLPFQKILVNLIKTAPQDITVNF